MSSAFILQHAPSFAPGRIVPIFRDFGIPVQLRKLYAGDEVPSDLDELRMLVVLGSPARLNDEATQNWPFFKKELELITRVIGIDRPTLAIGFGAQLLAHAAGAKVYPNVKPGAKPEDPATPMPEFGWGPVAFPFPGGTEPIVMGLSDGSPMFHWHRDTFDLPKLPSAPPPPGSPPAPTGNSLLSSSRACKNQAFRFRNRLFGFQYHFELTESNIDHLLSDGKEDLLSVVGPEGITRIRNETPQNYPRYARLGDRIVKNFVQFTRTY